jgi:hypothetical protein
VDGAQGNGWGIPASLASELRGFIFRILE